MRAIYAIYYYEPLLVADYATPLSPPMSAIYHITPFIYADIIIVYEP